MIETNNSEIDVNKLMDKVRGEVEKRNDRNRQIAQKAKEQNIIDTINLNLINVQALISNAEERSQVRTKWPDKLNRFPLNLSKKFQQFILKILNFFFKEQREVNISLVQAGRESLAINRELIKQIVSLQSQYTTLKFRLDSVESHEQSIDARLDSIESHEQSIDTRLDNTESHLKNLEASHKYLKNDIGQQKHLIDIFLAEAQKRLPEPFEPQQIQTFVCEQQHSLDAFYVAFEDRFRGSREEITARIKNYLTFVVQANVGRESSPILDLGCGRGEWLQLLKESGYIVRGVEINKVMVNECHSRGLEVIELDAIEYLQSLPEASLGAVTGFHIIEHLPFPQLLKLLTEVVRVLKPQGLVIFETPNPQNVLVGSNNFYIDPTHLNPLPSPLSKFLLEHAGLEKVEIINQNPYAESYKIDGSQEVVAEFNRYFYGPQDYAAIGYKA
jgi:2-polyprenyl-3-methyl-5-hydroxy-6-metoxy-1,4-benzoquinol methylase